MDAIVTAGGIPQPGEPLYDYTRGASKALLDIAGKPMVQWVLDALQGAASIERVVVVGLGPESGLQSGKIAAYLPNQGGMLENILAGIGKVCQLCPTTEYVLIVSSDIPAITPEMVEWTIRSATEAENDISYNVVPRAVMEERYPGSKRTYTHLKGLDVCGGDMNVVRAAMASDANAVWRRIIDARKSPLKQASILGYDNVLLLLLGQMSLENAVRRASQRLHLRARAIVCPYAEIGMDVDKPHQLELMRADLRKRPQGAGGV